MELKIISGVILLSAAIFGFALLVPDDASHKSQGLPWQIEKTADNNTRVFNITLGKTTLQEAEKILLGDGEISLFHAPDNSYSLEAYFDKVDIAGLTAKMILVMDLPQEELDKMYQRGVRISKSGSGSNKVNIATPDLHRTREAPIASITYLPSINLKADQIKAKFGEPKNRVIEPDTGVEHWLFPDIGLDIALDSNGKDVLQYVLPSSFAKISKPLNNL